MEPRFEAKRILISSVFVKLFKFFEDCLLKATAEIQDSRCSLQSRLLISAVAYQRRSALANSGNLESAL